MLRPWALLLLSVRRANDRLNFVAVDKTSDVGVRDLSSGEATDDHTMLVDGTL